MNAEMIEASEALSPQEQAVMEDLGEAVAELSTDCNKDDPASAAEVAAMLLGQMSANAAIKTFHPTIYATSMLLIAAVMVEAGLIDIEAIEGEPT